MTRHKAIQTLKHYQRWRLGSDDDTPMLEPKLVTQAISFAIEDLENIQKSIDCIVKLHKEHGYFNGDNWAVLKREFKINIEFQIGKEVDSKWFKVFDSVDILDYFTHSKKIETQEEIEYLTKKYL